MLIFQGVCIVSRFSMRQLSLFFFEKMVTSVRWRRVKIATHRALAMFFLPRQSKVLSPKNQLLNERGRKYDPTLKLSRLLKKLLNFILLRINSVQSDDYHTAPTKTSKEHVKRDDRCKIIVCLGPASCRGT